MDGETNLSLLLETAKNNLALFRRFNEIIGNEMIESVGKRISQLRRIHMDAEREIENYASIGVENRERKIINIWNKYWIRNKDFHQEAEKNEAALIERIITSKEEIPNEFLCPIGLSIMIDPVSLKFNGIPENTINYERYNISKWLDEGKKYDPLTKAEPVSINNYIPNDELSKQITMFFNTSGLGRRRRKVKQTKRRQTKRRQTKRRQTKRRLSKKN